MRCLKAGSVELVQAWISWLQMVPASSVAAYVFMASWMWVGMYE
jgi:hypothetical protein